MSTQTFQQFRRIMKLHRKHLRAFELDISHSMDAPELLPAGSMIRDEGVPELADFFALEFLALETYVLREEPHHD